MSSLSDGRMETDDYLYNWWLVLIGVFLLISLIMCVFKVILRFPGLLDWKFLVQNFEERVQEPVKKFSSSLYGQVTAAGGEMVRKISVRSRGRPDSGEQWSSRTRKLGVCSSGGLRPGQTSQLEEGAVEEISRDNEAEIL